MTAHAGQLTHSDRRRLLERLDELGDLAGPLHKGPAVTTSTTKFVTTFTTKLVTDSTTVTTNPVTKPTADTARLRGVADGNRRHPDHDHGEPH